MRDLFVDRKLTLVILLLADVFAEKIFAFHARLSITVITGFNTDIEYEGVTYHVQTEDKGLETPLILSLVYDRGTILASKRSPYDDLLANFDEKVLTERLQKQHKLICAAIRAGRIDDLKRMTMRESASKKKGLIAQREIKNRQPEISTLNEKLPVPPPIAEKVAVGEKISVKESKSFKKEEVPLPQVLHLAEERFQESRKSDDVLPPDAPLFLGNEFQSFKNEENWDIPISLSDSDLIIDEIDVIEEVTILPAEAVEIITDFSKHDEPANDKLAVELLNDVSFKAGENKTISVLVSRGTADNTVVGSSVIVKVLGSNFRPLIFHAKTDSNGVAIIQLHLPNFSRGRAAVMIKAISGNDEAELRRIIHPG